MQYIEGFLVAVPSASQTVYRDFALAAMPHFRRFGVDRMVEAWGEEVPRGLAVDLPAAVQAREDETVVFSWMEFRDKAARDQSFQLMADDPAMQAMHDMPFDGKRMVMGGFEVLLDTGGSARGSQVDGVVRPVRQSARDAYRAWAQSRAEALMEAGALRVVETWGDEVPPGKVTDFLRAVKLEEGEQVVFSWTEWPSAEARAQALQRLGRDPRLAPPSAAAPFDARRVIQGRFSMLVDE